MKQDSSYTSVKTSCPIGSVELYRGEDGTWNVHVRWIHKLDEETVRYDRRDEDNGVDHEYSLGEDNSEATQWYFDAARRLTMEWMRRSIIVRHSGCSGEKSLPGTLLRSTTRCHFVHTAYGVKKFSIKTGADITGSHDPNGEMFSIEPSAA